MNYGLTSGQDSCIVTPYWYTKVYTGGGMEWVVLVTLVGCCLATRKQQVEWNGCDSELLAVTSNKYVAVTAVHTVATVGTKKERF